jgi:acetoin utilization deacetylase AcuC-like enzyme
VRAILERKYGRRCPAGYIDMIVDSIDDDPIQLRAPRYLKKDFEEAVRARRPRQRHVVLVVNDTHHIHHVNERGYVEAPVRIPRIMAELDKTEVFERVMPQHFSSRHIKAVHDPGFVDFLHRACEKVPAGKSVYPYVFPLRNQARPPKELPLRAGYYCIDTFTPLNENAYRAALGAVDCALTCARAVIEGKRYAYALVRPPGHHAERRAFGGFCYFNSAAVAANYLSRFGKVAVLDVDYHHGNGTQDIFYERDDVLTVSIHGHPRYTYPYFSGYEDEKGHGKGQGYNLNIPLPENIDGERHRAALEIAAARIRRFAPQFLVLSLGLDSARGDPTGSWTLGAKDFRSMGERIAALGLPTLVVQEGGYLTRTLGVNARHFFLGLWQGAAPGSAQADPAARGAKK